MATCPKGHASASDDFCDVCGVLIAAAPRGNQPAQDGPGPADLGAVWQGLGARIWRT